ncbi:collagen alpha-1(XXVIII) chain isoform X2 [Octopus bimaculoides]|nr:collagen alpha-1(XXVIII) chain isoform X2 [Octopus bimaculoides]
MLVMDSSSSIWIEDYKKQLQFARELVDNFDIGQTNSHVRVGAITFSRTAHLDIPLGRYASKKKLQKAIIKIPYRTGETNTAEALRLLRTEIEPKMKVFTAPFMVIVITDGKSRDSWSTRYEAHLLHKLGVHIYAIGVGLYYDLRELKSIASDPVRNIRLVSSYSALENIAKQFGVKTCEDITTPPPTTTTTTPKPTTTTTTPKPTTTTTTPKPTTTTTTPKPTTTKIPRLQRDDQSAISFGYDLLLMGAYRANMITRFINTLLPYTDYGNFAVVTYAHCPTSYDVPFTSLLNKSEADISHSIKLNVPGLADVVHQIGNELYKESNINKSKTAVLFIDPLVSVIKPDVVSETKKLKQNGAKVFLISVGRKEWRNIQLVRSLSSQPYHRYIYNAPNYNRLVQRAEYRPFQYRKMCKSNRL